MVVPPPLKIVELFDIIYDVIDHSFKILCPDRIIELLAMT